MKQRSDTAYEKLLGLFIVRSGGVALDEGSSDNRQHHEKVDDLTLHRFQFRRFGKITSDEATGA